MEIDVTSLDFKQLNDELKKNNEDTVINGCCGQRFIASSFSDKKITINGVPGNALGAYLNGAEITVNGNAQDAVGDTMNNGKIVVHGSIGDALGYSMRGGEIYVKGDAGYRAGIHMKEYKEKRPVIVIGGKAGSFLGEYQAGGIIIVLGLSDDERRIVHNFPCTGMHGGKVFLRSDGKDIDFHMNVTASKASDDDLDNIKQYIKNFCRYFGYDYDMIMNSPFTKIQPDSNNPYKQLYVAN